MRGCIQLAKKHLNANVKAAHKNVKAKSSDPFGAGGGKKSGGPVTMMNMPSQSMGQPVVSQQSQKMPGKGGMAAVQMLNDAVRNNNAKFAEELLQGGTNPVPMGKNQNTALHIAASIGSTACVVLLLKYGCSADVQTDTGDTALHLCGKGGHYECAEALLRAGANKTIRNNSSETPGETMQNTMIHLQNPNATFMKTLNLLTQ